jgi:hypothetical protein
MTKSESSTLSNKKKYKSPIKKRIINYNYGNTHCADAVWEKATIIPRKDPTVFRRDGMGKIIKRDKLNSVTSKYSWNIDHIIPRSRGGSDFICNLQPLNRKDNICFSDKLTQEKPNYNIKQHHDALLTKSGFSLNNKKPKLIIGEVVYARQTPIVKTWSFAKIININKQNETVTVFWIDAAYEDILYYNASLFDTNFTL